jgi:hypothetical protein
MDCWTFKNNFMMQLAKQQGGKDGVKEEKVHIT